MYQTLYNLRCSTNSSLFVNFIFLLILYTLTNSISHFENLKVKVLSQSVEKSGFVKKEKNSQFEKNVQESKQSNTKIQMHNNIIKLRVNIVISTC